MSLIIATGSNLGQSIETLHEAKIRLCEHFNLIEQSEIFVSKAQEVSDQPDFFNQVLEFELPKIDPDQAMLQILQIEKSLGRVRTKRYGARTIDIDIIFWALETIETPNLRAPHPKWTERSFVVKPLQQLPFFKTIEKCFTIVKSFEIDAQPLKRNL